MDAVAKNVDKTSASISALHVRVWLSYYCKCFLNKIYFNSFIQHNKNNNTHRRHVFLPEVVRANILQET